MAGLSREKFMQSVPCRDLSHLFLQDGSEIIACKGRKLD